MTASFLAALPSTLGFGTGLEAPFPPITISEKADSLLSVCLFPVTAGKCIRGPAAGAEGAGFWEVGGNSVTGCTEGGCFYWP